MEVVIDASVLVALLNPYDVWHARALVLLDALREASVALIYYDCVAAEAISAVARRLHEKGRAVEVQALLDRLNARIPYETLTWILPNVPDLYPYVLDLVRVSSGELNFNDGLIALACRERNILAIASFDSDFDRITWLKRLAEPSDVDAFCN
jgi:predicted nucleic acid-binding protein